MCKYSKPLRSLDKTIYKLEEASLETWDLGRYWHLEKGRLCIIRIDNILGPIPQIDSCIIVRSSLWSQLNNAEREANMSFHIGE